MRPRRTEPSSASSSAPAPAPKVAIGVCAYRRPRGLEKLLAGLDALTFRHGPEPEIRLIVVDNDPEGSAAPVLERYRGEGRFLVRYRREPKTGLSFARNALLDAVPRETRWLATIDDDEVPEPQWLDEHLRIARKHDAALVGGTLLPVFETEPPAWMREGRFFEIGPFQDGAPASFIGAGNALIDLERIDGRFDPRFNATGGEDEAFFERLIREKGLKAVTANDARVHETIPAARATLGALVRRHFRMGTTRAVIERDVSSTRAALRAFKSIARIGRGSLGLILSIVRGRAAGAAALFDVAFGAGGVAGLLGARLEEYRPEARSAPPRPGAADATPPCEIVEPASAAADRAPEKAQ